MTGEKTQADKFKDAAKEHGADEDETRWEERLRRVAKKPSSGKEAARPNED